ncbi:MAG: hypothetical protein HYV95_05155 [Opitutae bacterium]|nr:hypothetical protein [Opitutae bacterium]
MLLAVAGQGATAAPLTAGQKAALRAAKTVAVEIKQSYSWREEERVAAEAEKAKDGEAGEPGKKPVSDILPLTELTTAALAHAGWQPAAPGEAAEVRLVIEVYGEARGGDYMGTVSGHQYSGAQLSGDATLLWKGEEVLRETFSGDVAPPHQINRYYTQPWDAPFQALLPDILVSIYRIEESVHGFAPVLACLQKEQDPQSTAAARVLFARGDATVQPPLLEALRSEEEPRGAVAAAGLGVFGDASVLPALLEALRRDQASVAVPTAEEEYRLSELTTFEYDPEERSARADQARHISYLGRAEALAWALLQNPAPDKVRQLAAAMRDRHYPALARCRVALVLGRLRDAAADEALLAALQDEDMIVRAAAISALDNPQRPSSRRVAEALLARATDPQPFIRRRVRTALAQVAPGILEEFLHTKYGRNAPLSSHIAEGLAHSDVLVRLGTVHIVSLFDRNDAGLGKLYQSEPSPVVREAIVELLAQNSGYDALLALALADTDEATRLRALTALDAGSETGETGNEKKPPLPEAALAPLLAMLDQDKPPEPAHRVLSRVQGAGVDAGLLKTARRENARPELREIVLIELGRRGVRSAAPLLVAQLARPVSPMWETPLVEAAAHLDDPAMLDPLIALLRQGSPAARALAARVLGGMSHTKSVGPLIAALRQAEADGSGETLITAAGEALHNLTGKDLGRSDAWLRWWKENAGKPIVRPPPQPPAEEPPSEKSTGDEPHEP